MDDDDNDLPNYEDVKIEKHEEASRFLDTYSSESDYDEIAMPEDHEISAHKYNIEPDIPTEQKHDFDPNRAFFGRHVVNSNTKRKDNFRHLMQMDLCDIYDMIPSRRQRSTQIRQRVTAEYQSCRSNPEVGGFDRKLQRAVIRREDVDVRQSQSLYSENGGKKKKSSMLGFIKNKKKGG